MSRPSSPENEVTFLKNVLAPHDHQTRQHKYFARLVEINLNGLDLAEMRRFAVAERPGS